MRNLLRLLLTLALAAVPVLATPAPAHAVTVTAATAGTKLVTLPTQVWGTAPGAPNRPARVEVLVNNRWSTSQIGRTSGTGSYSLPLTYGINTAGVYVYRVGVTLASGAVSYSPIVSLERLYPRVTAATAGRVYVGANTRIWGSAGLAGRPVSVQVVAAGRWATIATGTTSASGSYAIALKYGGVTPGTYTFRAGLTLPTGVVLWSAQVTLQRLPISVSAATAGFAAIGAATNVWGTAAGAANRPMSLQALVGGAWVTVNSGRSTSSGSYRLAVTYGVSTPGTHTYRVLAHSVLGSIPSRSVTLVRPGCLSAQSALSIMSAAYQGRGIRILSLRCAGGNLWAFGTGEIWDTTRTFKRTAWVLYRYSTAGWTLPAYGTHASNFLAWAPGTANYNSAPPEVRAWLDGFLR